MSLLWCGFHPWPGNFHVPRVWWKKIKTKVLSTLLLQGSFYTLACLLPITKHTMRKGWVYLKKKKKGHHYISHKGCTCLECIFVTKIDPEVAPASAWSRDSWALPLSERRAKDISEGSGYSAFNGLLLKPCFLSSLGGWPRCPSR